MDKMLLVQPVRNTITLFLIKLLFTSQLQTINMKHNFSKILFPFPRLNHMDSTH